jgi:hypothetical protein
MPTVRHDQAASVQGRTQRRGRQPLEGVGGEQQKGQKRDADQALDAERAGVQARRQVAPECRQRRPEERQDQHPEQHGALVVSPDAGDLVEQRLRRMRVLRHVGDGEIGDDVGVGERAEGDGDQQKLRQRRRLGHRHHRPIAPRRAGQRQRALQQRHQGGEDQGEMADLRDHAARLRPGPRTSPRLRPCRRFLIWPPRPSARPSDNASNGRTSSARRRPRAACSSRRAWRGSRSPGRCRRC